MGIDIIVQIVLVFILLAIAIILFIIFKSTHSIYISLTKIVKNIEYITSKFLDEERSIESTLNNASNISEKISQVISSFDEILDVWKTFKRYFSKRNKSKTK